MFDFLKRSKPEPEEAPRVRVELVGAAPSHTCPACGAHGLDITCNDSTAQEFLCTAGHTWTGRKF